MLYYDQLTEDLILLQRLRYLAQRYETNTYEWLSAYQCDESNKESTKDKFIEVDNMHDKFTTLHNCVCYIIEQFEKELSV